LAHRAANDRSDGIGIMFPLAAWSDSLANQELLEFGEIRVEHGNRESGEDVVAAVCGALTA
jgi:hypothetical protein